MLRSPMGTTADSVNLLRVRRPFDSPIGFMILLPGFHQRRWGQPQRGWSFLGSFLSALFVALWTWGTPQFWGFLALTVVTHIASITDVLRQTSFPVYPARRATMFVAAALLLVFYAPALIGLSSLAWPGFEPADTGVGFLVNRYAYRGARPSQGQWIWMHPSVAGEPRAAQVVATSGQEVEWNGQSWKVDGTARLLNSPGRLNAWPQTCRFKVPANLILVEPRDDGVSAVPIGPVVLVSPDRIVGRAWAQFYPVWDRRML